MRRAEIESFPVRAKAVLRAAFRGRPLLLLVLSAVAVMVLGLAGTIGVLLAAPALLGFALLLQRSTANDEPFEWPSTSDLVEEVLVPAGRALAALWPVALLAYVGVYELVVAPWQIEPVRAHSMAVTLLLSPSFWIASLASLAFAPMALVQATLAQGWGAAVNPVESIRLSRRYPDAWKWLSAIGAGAFVAAFLVRWGLSNGPMAFLLAALTGTAGLLAACAVGGALIYLRADELSWGRANEALVELGDPTAPAMYQPSEPAPAPASGQHLTSTDAQLEVALEAKDAALVTRLFNDDPAVEQRLPGPTLLRIGQAAASVGDYSAALRALMRASLDQSDNGARALIIAGRILDERLRDTDGARRLFQQVLTRFPQTSAAVFAARQLAEPRFFLARR